MTLREAMADKGWTFRHVSILSDITERTLYRIADGTFFPSLTTANKLAAVFGCELEFRTISGEAARCKHVSTAQS